MRTLNGAAGSFPKSRAHSPSCSPVKQPPRQKPPQKRIQREPILEDIRLLLVEKARAGGREEVKALLSKFGAKKLSDVALADYSALAAEAEMIGNG